MLRKFLFSFAVVTLAVASAETYKVSLYQSTKLGDSELKPGEYKVEVVDQKAIFRNGKLHGEAPVKVETGDTKYRTTSVRINGDDSQLREIDLGGTKTKLVFAN
jgi:hypothetical protein